jgi:multidrug efflux system membrane fusion protein
MVWRQRLKKIPHSRAKVSLVILGILVIGILVIRHHQERNQAGKVAKAPPAIPVATTIAKKGDIGVYIEALGTVTPVYTVNAISRVQGQITSVNYREGQIVKKGDLLVQIDARPYEAAVVQAQGTLAHDQGELKEAEIDLQRYRKAYKKNAIAKQLLDDQEQIVLQDQGTVQADQGALETAKLNVVYCNITSPIDGRVGLRLVDPGNMIQANSTTPLVVVTQIQPITVIFSVAEDYISQIQDQIKNGTGMTVEAYDRSQEKKIATGDFLTLDNQVDTTTGTVKVRAIFANENNQLFPNQFVNAKLLVKTQKDSTLISSAAIQRGAEGTFVYVVNPSNQTVELKKIVPGTTDGNETAVEGIHPGDTLVENGFDKLQNGAKIAVHQLAGQVAGEAAKP